MTSQPVDTGPLPAPTLGSADEIVAAMSDPAQAEQVVVSTLQLLGIGLYEPDGSPIRTGTETSDADFYLFEPGARGLANMLRDRADPDEQMSFHDFHAALAGAGYAASAEVLAATYADAYAARPDALISRLVAALGPVDVDGSLPSFEIWLLLLDGFIRPNPAASAMAMAGDPVTALAVEGPGWGVARSRVLAVPLAPVSEWFAMVGQLNAIAAAWRITVTASPATVHEGHGGLGTPALITAQLSGPTTPLVSPFGGATVVPAPSGVAGALVAWIATSPASDHGSLSDPATPASQGGAATTTYTPKQELANGQGIDRIETANIYGGVQRAQLLLQLYGTFAAPYVGFMTTFKKNQAIFQIGWHEKAEAVVKIVWTDTYDGVDDTIIFLGNLTNAQPDPVSGGVMYSGTGTATGSRAGWKACNPGIDVVPSGTVPATFNGFLTGTGSIVIAAYADMGTALSGISTAGMEVPIVGGFAQFDLPTVGDLCPHRSHGEMTVTQLVLP